MFQDLWTIVKIVQGHPCAKQLHLPHQLLRLLFSVSYITCADQIKAAFSKGEFVRNIRRRIWVICQHFLQHHYLFHSNQSGCQSKCQLSQKNGWLWATQAQPSLRWLWFPGPESNTAEFNRDTILQSMHEFGKESKKRHLFPQQGSLLHPRKKVAAFMRTQMGVVKVVYALIKVDSGT